MLAMMQGRRPDNAIIVECSGRNVTPADLASFPFPAQISPETNLFSDRSPAEVVAFRRDNTPHAPTYKLIIRLREGLPRRIKHCVDYYGGSRWNFGDFDRMRGEVQDMQRFELPLPSANRRDKPECTIC
ncbi:hypothetical protein PHSY_004203 [Pseudozyma hubeiensis SY62]|uniref:Uncharacterized protein n=1 Tax=Pseudozyma hubeiensis (strain SY62) TaxID=1305764 RepID=R9PET6_PSEHS|nr:hypothetical protein PHSY_004203 [Pseudozyma hubeiensis SY62]GAC96620.1 hypothetical protein PHSY_004203 [Pseudozyma hubeiensis SY62]